MKKAICLTLAALTLSAALTGCAGMAGTDDRVDGNGNVSKNRDGTISQTDRNDVFGENGTVDRMIDRT